MSTYSNHLLTAASEAWLYVVISDCRGVRGDDHAPNAAGFRPSSVQRDVPAASVVLYVKLVCSSLR